ncbi:MAG TPA: sigma-70 family RNA polymerase sigma factor [Myxococcota bacterium]|nr:sigma-70 family RNA polymerase sigma factor [Myxococcota bacterium]
MSSEARREALGAIVKSEAGLVLASLIAGFGDFDLAEDALQDAVAAALERWPRDGVPQSPAAWLTVVARRRVVDRLRHQAMRTDKAAALRASEELRRAELAAAEADDNVPDERLRLLFTCCHPALSPEARVALTLRTLGGLSTEAVARAFLLPVATLAKRLERAKRKIREARIPYRVPPETEWTVRLRSILAVLYLIFNEGYSASDSPLEARRALCEEAIGLARVLAALLPREGEVHALLALMLLHDARRDARVGPDGIFVPLDEQDRRRWRSDELLEGLAALRAAAARPGRGPYQVQAAIAAAHAVTPNGADTPWHILAALYAELEALAPSPVVRVNRAVAEGRARGPAAGLGLLAALEGGDAARNLAEYQPYHAARADLLRRAGRAEEAAAAYRTALDLCSGEPERRFLARWLGEIVRGPQPDKPELGARGSRD